MGVGGKDHSPATLRGGKIPGAYFTGGWLGPTVGLEGSGTLCSHLYLIPGPSNSQRLAIPTILSFPTLLLLRRPTLILTSNVPLTSKLLLGQTGNVLLSHK
jgi:hypothetical protein